MSEPSIGILNHIFNSEFSGFSKNNDDNNDDGSKQLFPTGIVNNFRQEAWYCLFIGIPAIINLVIIYYVMKWLFFKYKFGYLFIPDSDSANCEDIVKTFSEDNENDNDVTNLDNSTSTTHEKSASLFDNVGHLIWPYSDSKPSCPEYEKMHQEDVNMKRSNDNFDLVIHNNNQKLRRFSFSSSSSNENIISLRKLSAKYDSVLLQLSAMSCHRRFKRLLKTMNRSNHTVAKQHDIKQNKLFDILLENHINNKSKPIKFHDFTRGDNDYKYTKLSATNMTLRKPRFIGRRNPDGYKSNSVEVNDMDLTKTCS